MNYKSTWYYKKIHASCFKLNVPVGLKLPAGYFLLIILYFLPIKSLISQPKELNDLNYKKFYTPISLQDSVILLPDRFILENSIKLFADSTEVPASGYYLDNRYGKIKLIKIFFSLYAKDTAEKIIGVIIVYRNLPYQIPDLYSKFQILPQVDTLKKDTVQVAEIKSDFMEDIFSGTNLEKSGSIFRGFTIGNNRDLTLNSGFHLQMTGKLSKDIDIVAALTDESTPIQPEGNTQKLQELDKVFIELRSKNYTATLGDIDVNMNNGEFLNFSRKVQGAKGLASFDRSNYFIAAAISRGTFNTNTFNGTDGVQGPYRLVGANNEVNILIVAGTEKVYLDGNLMTRGESNDYTIDYSNGQFTFTNRRLITNASRITVDFEYSSKKYERNLITAQAQNLFFKDRLKITFSYLREADDKTKPIDFTLSDSDKTILSTAGNDKIKASKSGVSYVGRDSTGHALGYYVKHDTTNGYSYYVYLPGDTNALYQVAFSYVGNGKGDYLSLSTQAYQFVGIGQGSYLPIIFIPLPTAYQTGDLSMDFSLFKSLILKTETNVTNYDRNLYSSLDKKGNTGAAINTSLVFSKDNVSFGGLRLGQIDFVLKQKVINKYFSPLDRFYQIEYNRVWDIQDSSVNQYQNITETELKLKPKNYFGLEVQGGRINRGDYFKSLRGAFDVMFKKDSSYFPIANYHTDIISSKDYSIDYKGFWIRQNGTLNYKFIPHNLSFGNYDFLFTLNGEDKEMKSIQFDTTNSTSFRYYEFKPRLSVFSLFHLDLSYEFNYRLDDAFNAGYLTRQSNSYTNSYSLKVKDFDFLSTNFDITTYKRKYTAAFISQGFSNNNTVLVTSQSNVWAFNRGFSGSIFYKVSSEKTAKTQTIFIKVPVGQGNYIYLGDLNHNGIQDENEFQLVNYGGDYIKIYAPTDQTFPTTDLQSSLSMSFNPSRVFNKTKEGILKDIIYNVSFDTYLAVAERSKDPKQSNIYLLRLSKFQNDSNTLAGTNTIQQDINLFENYQYFGIRLRFLQTKGFNQYYSGNERQLNVERSTRLRLSFTNDLTLNSDYIVETNRNLSPDVIIRNWNINGYSVASELTYVPIRQIETGFKLEFKNDKDYYQASPTPANVNKQTFKFAYSIEATGKLRIEFERDEAIIGSNLNYIPYELTKGIPTGKSYIWTLNFDYRLTNFIQATIGYNGRAQGNSRVIHTGTAELKAYF